MKTGQVNGELNLLDYWRIIWKRKWVITAFAFSGTLISAIATLFMADMYRASAVINPVNGREGGGGELQMVAQQFGSLPGITLPASRSSSEIISLLNSNILREKMIEGYDLLPVLFSERWDSAKKEWKIEKGGAINHFSLLGKISELFPIQKVNAQAAGNSSVTVWDGLRSLSEIIRVSPNVKDNTITISAEYKDPVIAASLVERLLSTLNQHMSSEARRVAQINKRYLLEQLNSSNDPIIRQKVFNLVAQQVEIYMMSEVKENFAFKMIDPPRVPDRRFKPKRFSIVKIAFAASLAVGVFAGFILEFNETSSKNTANEQMASSSRKDYLLSAEEDGEPGGEI